MLIMTGNEMSTPTAYENYSQADISNGCVEENVSVSRTVSDGLERNTACTSNGIGNGTSSQENMALSTASTETGIANGDTSNETGNELTFDENIELPDLSAEDVNVYASNGTKMGNQQTFDENMALSTLTAEDALVFASNGMEMGNQQTFDENMPLPTLSAEDVNVYSASNGTEIGNEQTFDENMALSTLSVQNVNVYASNGMEMGMANEEQKYADIMMDYQNTKQMVGAKDAKIRQLECHLEILLDENNLLNLELQDVQNTAETKMSVLKGDLENTKKEKSSLEHRLRCIRTVTKELTDNTGIGDKTNIKVAVAKLNELTVACNVFDLDETEGNSGNGNDDVPPAARNGDDDRMRIDENPELRVPLQPLTTEIEQSKVKIEQTVSLRRSLRRSTNSSLAALYIMPKSKSTLPTPNNSNNKRKEDPLNPSVALTRLTLKAEDFSERSTYVVHSDRLGGVTSHHHNLRIQSDRQVGLITSSGSKFSCNSCGDAFKTRRDLFFHQKDAHNCGPLSRYSTNRSVPNLSKREGTDPQPGIPTKKINLSNSEQKFVSVKAEVTKVGRTRSATSVSINGKQEVKSNFKTSQRIKASNYPVVTIKKEKDLEETNHNNGAMIVLELEVDADNSVPVELLNTPSKRTPVRNRKTPMKYANDASTISSTSAKRQKNQLKPKGVSKCPPGKAHESKTKKKPAKPPHRVIKQTKNSSVIKCSCGKIFTHRSALLSHIKLRTRGNIFKCSICSKGYARRDYVRRHLRIVHGKKVSKSTKGKKEATVRVNKKIEAVLAARKRNTNNRKKPVVHGVAKSKNKGEITCLCGRKFLRENTLFGHLRLKIGKKIFKCESCPESFSRYDYFKHHLRRAHQQICEGMGCKDCGARGFLTYAELMAHRQEYHAKKTKSVVE